MGLGIVPQAFRQQGLREILRNKRAQVIHEFADPDKPNRQAEFFSYSNNDAAFCCINEF